MSTSALDILKRSIGMPDRETQRLMDEDHARGVAATKASLCRTVIKSNPPYSLVVVKLGNVKDIYDKEPHRGVICRYEIYYNDDEKVYSSFYEFGKVILIYNSLCS